MVSIGKNLGQMKDSVQLNNSKFNSEEIDEIFAELFSLVNLSSINNSELDNVNQTLVSSDSNENNEISTAKSLISIFYKEMKLNEHKDFELGFKLDEQKSKSMENNHALHSLFVKKNKTDINSEKNLDNEILKVESKFENKNSDLSPIKSELKKKPKPQYLNHSENILKKNTFLENNKELENQINKKFLNKSVIEDNTKNSIIQKNNEAMIYKKEKKKASTNDKLKLDVVFTKKEENITHSKTTFLSQIKLNTTNKEKYANLNFNKTDAKNDPKVVKEQNLSSNFNSQEVLDLLESSWGEKLVRLIQNSLNRGIHKVDINLEPKNLGKMKVEIEVTNEKTDIKIISDSKIAANILNDNQQKLNQMLEKETINLGFFSSNSGSNDSSKNFKDGRNSEKNSEAKKNVKIKPDSNISEMGLKRKTIHNVDINA